MLPLRVAVMAGAALAARSIAEALRSTGESLAVRVIGRTPGDGPLVRPGEVAVSLVASALDVESTEVIVAAETPLLWLLDETAADQPLLWRRTARGLSNARTTGWLGAWTAPEQWFAAITTLSRGLSVFEPGLGATLRAAGDPDAREAVALEGLTTREEQVLELLVRGMPNREIAHALGISSHTAKFHVAQILDKLGASTRTEAASLAMRRGLVGL